MLRKHSNVAIENIVCSLCERINSPRSLAMWLCFKHDHASLLDLPSIATAECSPEQFMLDYFISEYLSKYKGLKTGVDLRGAALAKWKLSEQLCSQTNSSFKTAKLRPFTGRVEAALFGAQRKIASVLGKLSLPTVLADCKWGPGATFDLRREVATPDKKISHAISVTAPALCFLRAVVESDPHWAYCFLGIFPEGRYTLLPDCYQVVRGSRFLTVPKSAKTDRCIAAEPTGNGFLQQGVHTYMRRRLKRFGVDLDDQSINQKRAADAYLSGLSTLDLSAASDTISRELVFHLLPLDWALFLDSIRSPETLVDGEWIRTEKFASMGNAFCFELETLIFWALASSVSEILGSVNSVSVYGDDIIVDRVAYDSVVEILTVCGFVVNSKKSFKSGNFFESCGKHFYKGFDVTPVYQKELVSSPSEIIRAHNRLIRFSSRTFSYDKWFVTEKAAQLLANSYPLRPFPRIPYGVTEDGGFLRPLGEFSPDPNHGFRCHVLDYVPAISQAREDALYAYKLRRFVQQNPSRTGHAGNSTKGKWRTKVRWVHESSIHDDKCMASMP